MANNAVPKWQVNPELLAALQHYAHTDYDFAKPHLYVYRRTDGWNTPWSLGQTCECAKELLSKEPLYTHRYANLLAQMRADGMQSYLDRHGFID